MSLNYRLENTSTTMMMIVWHVVFFKNQNIENIYWLWATYR